MHMKYMFAGLSALCLVGGAGLAQAAGPFDGVTVNVMTFTGAIPEPLQRRAPDFEKLTGAKINVITVPFSDLYTKLLTDWSSGTNSIDAAVFAPQWMVDYVAGGYPRGSSPTGSPRTRTSRGRRRRLLPRLLAEVRRQDLHADARWRLPHDLLPHRRLRGRRLKPPKTLGRLPRRRQGAERQGHERRRHARLRLLHLQEAQCPGLLVHHLDRRRHDPVQGHRPGRLLRYARHEAARQQRGLLQGARLPEGDHQVRSAERDQPRRRRHPRPVRRPAAAP